MNLGSRMLTAIKSRLEQNVNEDSGVILIGSDCLDLTAAHLQQAIDALRNHDLF